MPEAKINSGPHHCSIHRKKDISAAERMIKESLARARISQGSVRIIVGRSIRGGEKTKGLHVHYFKKGRIITSIQPKDNGTRCHIILLVQNGKEEVYFKRLLKATS